LLFLCLAKAFKRRMWSIFLTKTTSGTAKKSPGSGEEEIDCLVDKHGIAPKPRQKY